MKGGDAMIISPSGPEKVRTDADDAGFVERALESWPARLFFAGIGIAVAAVETFLTLWQGGPAGKILAVASILWGLMILGFLACVVTYSPPEPYVPFASSVPPETLAVAYDSGTVTFTNPTPDAITKVEMVQNGLLSSTSLYSVDLAYGESASFPAADLDEVRVSKIDGNTTEFSRYYVHFGRDSEGRDIVRIQ